jgi:hypothetical protein
MDKLQRAGRDFLMRLIAKHGLAGAARVLRALADDIEARPLLEALTPCDDVIPSHRKEGEE